MLRLGAASGDGPADVEPRCEPDIRPVGSGDGGRRWVGDGRGASVVLDAAPCWSPSLMVSGEPGGPVVDALPVAHGARYLCGRRYWEAVKGFV